MMNQSNGHAIALGNRAQVVYKSNVRSIEHRFDLFPRSTTMTALPSTVDRAEVSAAAAFGGPEQSLAPARRVPPAVRPGRRDGRGSGPQARPARALRGSRTLARAGSRSCSPTVPTVSSSATWRLTDRGIAVVLVTGMMIMVAALVVIGLTALRVTGDGYVAHGQSQLSTR
jgi:hypothetical protein